MASLRSFLFSWSSASLRFQSSSVRSAPVSMFTLVPSATDTFSSLYVLISSAAVST